MQQEKKNNCVFCKHEDGVKCRYFEKDITMNESFATMPGKIFGNKEYCGGFELEPSMADRWKDRFG